MAFIALLSHQTGVEGPASRGLAVPGADRFDHLAEYAVLGVLLAFAIRARNPLPWPPLVVALIIGSGYGALDELHQSFVPGRDGDAFDWVADTLGVALGWWAAERYRRFLRERVEA